MSTYTPSALLASIYGTSPPEEDEYRPPQPFALDTEESWSPDPELVMTPDGELRVNVRPEPSMSHRLSAPASRPTKVRRLVDALVAALPVGRTRLRVEVMDVLALNGFDTLTRGKTLNEAMHLADVQTKRVGYGKDQRVYWYRAP